MWNKFDTYFSFVAIAESCIRFLMAKKNFSSLVPKKYSIRLFCKGEIITKYCIIKSRKLYQL